MRAAAEPEGIAGAGCIRSGDEPHARPRPSPSGGAALTPGSGTLLSHPGPACSGAQGSSDPAKPPPGTEGLRMM